MRAFIAGFELVADVGDALPDPLTGITAAREGWRAYCAGKACRIGLSMTAIAAMALREEREHDPAALARELRDWAASDGQSFPQCPRRPMLAELRGLGADTAEWIAPC